MEYRNRAKSRRYRRILINTFENLKFRGAHLGNDSKLIALGSAISLFSLQLNWVEIETKTIYGDSFSPFVGSIGYVFMSLIIISLFTIFSREIKEKIKMFLSIHLHDHNIILFSSILMIIMTFTSIRYINGLSTFSEGVIHGKGGIVCLSGSVLILIGGYLMRKKKNEKNKGIYTSGVEHLEEEKNEEGNMKLPF